MYILESIGIDATHTALGIEDKGIYRQIEER